MKIDDLFGLLFLLFFIVGPALRGLLKPREPLVEVELPQDLEEVLRETAPRPQEPQPLARPKPAQAQSKPAAGGRAAAPAAPAATAVAAQVSPQTAEGHAAGSRSRHRIAEASRDAADMAAEERAAFARDQRRQEGRIGLSVSGKAIVRGMLWHEILNEPASKKRRRLRTKRGKLLS